MDLKNKLIEHASHCGFSDIGFTTAEVFTDQKEILESMKENYLWTIKAGIDLFKGTDPQNILPGAKSIIVIIDEYFNKRFPPSMEKHFGRCYLDDDRVTRDGLAIRIKEFRKMLRDNGINSKVPFNLSHRVAAARAGLGTYGKNCLLYGNKSAQGSSWITPIALVVDKEFEPDESTIGIDCPKWCRNTCISACPTRALKGNGTVDPHRCISYMTYYGKEITPLELREPMGLYIYGCDRCQDVCPRNRSWLFNEMPLNENVAVKAEHFDLIKLLHMDKDYFLKHIWPHMFYMSPDFIWKWKMNVARVMGNLKDSKFSPELIKAYRENDDLRVRGMIIWALQSIESSDAITFINGLKKNFDDLQEDLRKEINFNVEKNTA